MSNNSLLLEIEKLIIQEEEEAREAERIAEEVMPVLDKLTRSEIVNPVILKTRLSELDKKYCSIVYALFQVALKAGPEGSVVILSPKKVLSIIKDMK